MLYQYSHAEVPILAESGIQRSVNVSRQTRMNSCYLRELTLGKFIIKCDEVTLSENIGQGMSIFSSIVYTMSLLHLCVILHHETHLQGSLE